MRYKFSLVVLSIFLVSSSGFVQAVADDSVPKTEDTTSFDFQALKAGCLAMQDADKQDLLKKVAAVDARNIEIRKEALPIMETEVKENQKFLEDFYAELSQSHALELKDYKDSVLLHRRFMEKYNPIEKGASDRLEKSLGDIVAQATLLFQDTYKSFAKKLCPIGTIKDSKTKGPMVTQSFDKDTNVLDGACELETFSKSGSKRTRQAKFQINMLNRSKIEQADPTFSYCRTEGIYDHAGKLDRYYDVCANFSLITGKSVASNLEKDAALGVWNGKTIPDLSDVTTLKLSDGTDKKILVQDIVDIKDPKQRLEFIEKITQKMTLDKRPVCRRAFEPEPAPAPQPAPVKEEEKQPVTPKVEDSKNEKEVPNVQEDAATVSDDSSEDDGYEYYYDDADYEDSEESETVN